LTAPGKFNFDSVFRAYDIRGVFGEDLTEEVATRIGAAFATFLGEDKEVLVARDVRLSGEKLRKALVSGLFQVAMLLISVSFQHLYSILQ